MGQQWVSVVEAAAAMKVHTRTIERHIKSAKLQTRRGDDGQVQVLVELPDEPDPAADALSVVAGQAENQVQLALGTTSAIVRSAQEDARLARLNADQAWEETYVARRGSRAAWTLVGVMVIGTIVAVGWCTSRLTRASVDVEQAQHVADSQHQEVEQLSDDKTHLQTQLSLEQQRRARAEGELAGRVAADAGQKPDQPTSMFERLSAVFTAPPVEPKSKN
ncbi:MAG TPA: hypothetical protein VHY37_07140 [Tepidisphaeraceae bacterium]|nr:hypothetical protein [Tepidisphaeraceae bacterium]